VIYVLSSVAERAEKERLVKAIRKAPDEQTAIVAIEDRLDAQLAPVTSDEERQRLYHDVFNHLRDIEPTQEGVEREDVYGAVALVVMAIVATLPVVVPFLFIHDPFAAIRVSNLIAITMLFIVGYHWAKRAGAKPVKIGLLLAGIGVAIVLVAIPLGG
jgi:VIT1/CCC1 family predicted Fe2+/Mn2+ transporter